MKAVPPVTRRWWAWTIGLTLASIVACLSSPTLGADTPWAAKNLSFEEARQGQPVG